MPQTNHKTQVAIYASKIEMSDEYNAFSVKHELLLPEQLFIKLCSLVLKINEVQQTALFKVMHPGKHKTNMEAERFERYNQQHPV